jgi:NTE family protein
MAQVIFDYHELAKSLVNLFVDSINKIKENGANNDDIKELKRNLKVILTQEQRTTSYKQKPRYYYDLLLKKFDVEEVIKVQRKDDKHTISDKIFDFSSITIINLIREGEKDTMN